MKITLIAALTDEGVIGREGKIPWHISEDLKRFKQKTMGHAIIMGRKTFDSILESLGKPLPGRTNIVITRSAAFKGDGAHVFHWIKDALDFCRKRNEQNVFIIGGGEIYRQTIALADELVLTFVHQQVEGDTGFPSFDRNEWVETFRENHGKFTFVEFTRKRASS